MLNTLIKKYENMNILTNTEDKNLAILKVLNTNDKTHSTKQNINILTDITEEIKELEKKYPLFKDKDNGIL